MMQQTEHLRSLLDDSRFAMREGREAWASLSTEERAAVALVLNRADWLEEFGCTLADAIEAAGDEGIEAIPTVARALAREGL